MLRPAHEEPHGRTINSTINWLRAGVLGANDGLVSTAGLVVGVAGATAERDTLLVAGVAGILAGALSMAAGEYVSVSTQRDTERALIARETRELVEDPEAELQELADMYATKGLSDGLARAVAEELTAKDALQAHLDVELKLDPDDLTNPWHAGMASFFAFLIGAFIPMTAILLAPQDLRLWITATSVLIGMALTGAISARLGGAPWRPAVIRNIVGGAIVMMVTFGVGVLVGGAAGI